MKKLLIVLTAASLWLTSCSKVDRTFDSEIRAIRDQTEVLKQQNDLIEAQNKILQQIADNYQ